MSLIGFPYNRSEGSFVALIPAIEFENQRYTCSCRILASSPLDHDSVFADPSPSIVDPGFGADP